MARKAGRPKRRGVEQGPESETLADVLGPEFRAWRLEQAARADDPQAVLSVFQEFVSDVQTGSVPRGDTLETVATLLDQVIALDCGRMEPKQRKAAVTCALGLSSGWPGKNEQRNQWIVGLFRYLRSHDYDREPAIERIAESKDAESWINTAGLSEIDLHETVRKVLRDEGEIGNP